MKGGEDMTSSKCDYKHIAIPAGLLLAVIYIICYFWGYTNDDPAVQELHLNLLKLSFLGFSGLNGLSFFLGLIQSFIWGLIVGAVFYLGYRHCPCESCGACMVQEKS